MYITILLLSALIYFFCLYIFSKEDYLLIRKNISVEEMFNLSFLGLLVVIVVARLFFVIVHPSFRYLNPLVFFLFPYFPGLSLLGAIVGGSGFLFFITREGKKPTKRIFDIFSMSFLLSLSPAFFIQGIVNLLARKNILLVVDFSTCILYLVSCIFLVRWFVKNKYSDGVTSALVVMTIATISVVRYFLLLIPTHRFVFSLEPILWGIVMVSGIVYLIMHRKK